MKALALAALLSSALASAASPGDTWFMGVTGGGSLPYAQFTEVGVEHFAGLIKDWKIPAEKSANLHGFGPYRFQLVTDPARDAKMLDLYKKLMSGKRPDCKVAEQLHKIRENEENLTYEGNSAFLKKIDESFKAFKAAVAKVRNKKGKSTEELAEQLAPKLGIEPTFVPIIVRMVDNPKQIRLRPMSPETETRFQQQVTGQATPTDIDATAASLAAKAKQGDHFFLNINDHGEKEEGRWSIVLGRENESMDGAALGKLISALSAKGVQVHLNLQACYSGGFQKLTLTRPDQACMVTDGHEDHPAWARDVVTPSMFDDQVVRKLNQYGSQLEAYACSLALDDWNQPSTTLDAIVRDWSSGGTREECSTDSSGLSGFQKGLDQILTQDPETEKLRGLLLAEHGRMVEGTYRSCQTGVANDREFRNRMISCVSKFSGYDKAAKAEVRDLYQAPNNRPTHASYFAAHRAFLEKAGRRDLERFKQAFCCLSYNLRDKRPSSEICK